MFWKIGVASLQNLLLTVSMPTYEGMREYNEMVYLWKIIENPLYLNNI